MKDATNLLRAAYYTRLVSKLTSPVVKVYDLVPDNAAGEYVAIGTATMNEDSIKDQHLANYTVLLDVVTKFTGMEGGHKRSTDIADLCIQAIRDRSSLLTITGFTIIVTVVESVNELEEHTATEHIYRRLVRFRHLIAQL